MSINTILLNVENFESSIGWIILIIVGILIGLAIYFLPSIIAISKGHKYKWVILAINLVFGASGVGWDVSMIWFVWPKRSSILDPIGDPSGAGSMPSEFGNSSQILRRIQARKTIF